MLPIIAQEIKEILLETNTISTLGYGEEWRKRDGVCMNSIVALDKANRHRYLTPRQLKFQVEDGYAHSIVTKVLKSYLLCCSYSHRGPLALQWGLSRQKGNLCLSLQWPNEIHTLKNGWLNFSQRKPKFMKTFLKTYLTDFDYLLFKFVFGFILFVIIFCLTSTFCVLICYRLY